MIEEKQTILKRLKQRTTSDQPPVIIMTSPEQIVGRAKFRVALNMAIKRENIDLFIIDEGHCVSMWGETFRSSYRRMPEALPLLRTLKVLNMSATLTEHCVHDIESLLQVADFKRVVGTVGRPNVEFSVRVISQMSDKWKILKRAMKNRDAANGAAVVFCPTREKCDKVREFLAMQGVESVTFHGGLNPHQKEENIAAWMTNQPGVICATSALGMGYNKHDVNLIIHLNAPDSLTNYYQEAGRAGRAGDTTKNKAILFFDASKFIYFLD